MRSKAGRGAQREGCHLLPAPPGILSTEHEQPLSVCPQKNHNREEIINRTFAHKNNRVDFINITCAQKNHRVDFII